MFVFVFEFPVRAAWSLMPVGVRVPDEGHTWLLTPVGVRVLVPGEGRMVAHARSCSSSR